MQTTSNANTQEFVIFSASEAAASGDGAGYWSNRLGWTTCLHADQFTQEHKQTTRLPMSCGGDAVWLDRLQALAAQNQRNTQRSASDAETIQVRLVVDVTYHLNGHTPDELLNHLHNMVQDFADGGGLTGATDCLVEDYSIEADVQEPTLCEDEIAELLANRIESGDIALEDLPKRLARYGLMQPQQFDAEMRERLGMLKVEDGMALGV